MPPFLLRNATMVALVVLATAASAAPKEIALFNGEDLAGWYTFLRESGKNHDPKGVFQVRDGRIVISGEEWGCITTEAEYENYVLTTEWRWTGKAVPPREEKTLDSGILIHSQGEDGGYSGTWMHSIEIQMIEGGTGDFIVVGNGTDDFQISVPAAAERQGNCPVYEEGGERVTLNKGRANWWGRDPDWEDRIGFRGARDVEHPVGEWNVLEITARGDQITVVLNGVKVNEAFDVRPAKGRIQVQSEAAELEIRKMTLRPLDAEPAP